MKAAIKLNKFKDNENNVFCCDCNKRKCVKLLLTGLKARCQKNLPNTEICNKYSNSIPNYFRLRVLVKSWIIHSKQKR